MDGLLIYGELISIFHLYLNTYHPESRIKINNNKRKLIWWNAECSKSWANKRLVIGEKKKIDDSRELY